MGWCDDIRFPKKYNKLININRNISHEMLYRKDYKYDLLIPIKYNFTERIPGKGSCIFIHLTKNYKPTAGCIALKKKDFLIMLKIIKKNTKIKIY
jgi:L,D-peptidoglycan transpeptidase YkuD (ErfK/YbiS/YcfS/YnhG family)